MSSPIKVNTRAAWAAQNPRLLFGELGQDKDTGNLKIGNGRQLWNDLPYHGCPGYWGSFWDGTSQVAAAINTAYAIKLRQADAASRAVRIISNERITVDHAGIYSLTFSIQFSNTDNSIPDINVWLRKNNEGSAGDVPASDSRFSIIARHGNIDGNVIGCVNFVLGLAANDYIELMWMTSNVAAYIHAEPAETSPAHPSIPGIICTVVQVASA